MSLADTKAAYELAEWALKNHRNFLSAYRSHEQIREDEKRANELTRIITQLAIKLEQEYKEFLSDI